MSKRRYADAAEKQRAYRLRQRDRASQPSSQSPPKPRPLSRPARIAALARAAHELAGEYQAWRDALPANLAESPMADELEQVSEQLQAIADELDNLEPPRIGR